MARCDSRTGHPAQGERHAGEGDDVGQQRQLGGGRADAAQSADPVPGRAGPIVYVLRRQQRQLQEPQHQPRAGCIYNYGGRWRSRHYTALGAAVGHKQIMVGLGSHNSLTVSCVEG